MDMRETLRHYLSTELLVGHAGELTDDENLLLSGLVDSIAVMRFIAFIEERFELTVPPEDVTIENFSTIQRIASYLQRRQA